MKRVTVLVVFTDVTGCLSGSRDCSRLTAQPMSVKQTPSNEAWIRAGLEDSLIMNLLSNGRGCLEVPRDSDSPSRNGSTKHRRFRGSVRV